MMRGPEQLPETESTALFWKHTQRYVVFVAIVIVVSLSVRHTESRASIALGI